MTLTIALIPHLDAGDRSRWEGVQDQRPLSELGHRQAAMIADVLARQPISALYASPALRCQQSLQPLSKRLELPVRVLAAFRESDGEFSPDPIENLRRGSYVAGRAYAALQDVVRAHGDGWAAVCSHGDLIPSLVAFLVGFHGLPPAASLTSRGEWYELRISGDGATVELRSAPLGFPVR